MNTTAFSFLLSSLAGLSTMIGTIPIFFKFNEKKIISAALAFASGVMISVSLTDLIPESLTLFHHLYRLTPTFLLMGIFIVLGIIFSMLIDKFLPAENIYQSKDKKLYRIGLISMLAIIFHNIPEGIATFMANSSNTKLGISLAIAIALHNIPEGISISVPLFYATKRKSKSLLYTFISGISEPFGALIAYWFLSPFINDVIMAILFAMIAGIMIHIAIYELLPGSIQYQQKKLSIICFIVGVIFMLVNHFIF